MNVPNVDAFAVAFASIQVATDPVAFASVKVAPDPAADNAVESVSIADGMVPVADDATDDGDDISSSAAPVQPLLTLNAVRDAIVSDSTNHSYNGYIFYFLLWLLDNHRECLN
jgi:hypothetical protein